MEADIDGSGPKMLYSTSTLPSATTSISTSYATHFNMNPSSSHPTSGAGTSHPSGMYIPPSVNNMPAYHPSYAALSNFNNERSPDYLSAYNNLQVLAMMQNYAKLQELAKCSSVPSTSANLQNAIAQSILHSESNSDDVMSCKVPVTESTLAPSVNESLSHVQSGPSNPAMSEQSHIDTPAPTPTSTNEKECIIINTVLAFIKSELLRFDQKAIIEKVSTNFTLEEIMEARKSLYRSTGSKKYVYRPPADPATTHEKANHCVASIISKITQLEKAAFKFKIVCDAEELFRLLHLHTNNNSENDHENRIAALERKMINLEKKSQPITFQPPITTFPHLPQIPRNNRSFADKASKPPNPKTPASAKRLRTAEQDKDNWTTVNGRNNRSHRSSSFFEGKNENTESNNELRGHENHEVFLFNYCNSATEEAVRSHFEKNGVSVINVMQKSRPEYEVKSYVMRIKQKDDFDKIVKCLPYRTRARWFIRPRQRFVENPAFTQWNQWNQHFSPRSPAVNTPTHQITTSANLRSPDRNEGHASTQPVNTEMEVASTEEDAATVHSEGRRSLIAAGIRPIKSPGGSNYNVPEFKIGGPVSLQRSLQGEEEVRNSLNPGNQDG